MLKIARAAAILRGVSLRPFHAILIAVALLFAPLAVNSGSAMAMAPGSDHHAEMTGTGHCGEKPAGDADGKAADKSCCAAMCTAIAVTPAAYVDPHELTTSLERPSLTQFHHGFLAKLPTPPPRLS